MKAHNHFSKKWLYDCPHAGPTSWLNSPLTRTCSTCYKLSCKIMEVSRPVQVCDRILHYSAYKFCPGLDNDSYMDKHHNQIWHHHHPSKVQVTVSPFKRVQSSDCTMQHKPPKNALKAEKSSLTVLCGVYGVSQIMHYCVVNVSLCCKIKQQQPSSNYPLQYMFPTSLKEEEQHTARVKQI